MKIARAQRLTRPDVSYGPFRYFEAVPWLLLAEACRFAAVILGTLPALLAFIAESIAVLMAFNAVAKRAFPLCGRPVPLQGMPFDQELRLSLRTFWRVAVVLIVSSALASGLGYASEAPSFAHGMVGIAFNQLSFIGRAWTALIAALLLLLLIDADRTGRPTLMSAFGSLAEHGFRFGAAVTALAAFYVGWGTIQILLFNAIWSTPALGGADPRTKSVIFFAVTFVFAFVRLWATLVLLASSLKPQGIRAHAASAASSSNRP
jgi:hypothetical protein